MNNDGWGFMGAGASDKRMQGDDLQHYAQRKTADEAPGRPRIVRDNINSGGPMKHNIEHEMHHHPMHHHLEEEKHRHHQAMEHHKHHLEKHHGRHYNSQHGHDSHKY